MRRMLISALALTFAGFLFSTHAAEAVTLTLQPDATTGLDTKIRQEAATTNYGSNDPLGIGEYYSIVRLERMLIKFDLSSIPNNAIIDSAQLKLKIAVDESDNVRTLRIYRTKRDWVESQATWNVWKVANNWSTAGGFHVDDCEQTNIGSVALSATEAVGTVITINLTSTTKAGLDLGNGWLLKMDTEANDAYSFYSSDAVNATDRPQLVVTYHVPILNPVIVVQ